MKLKLLLPLLLWGLALLARPALAASQNFGDYTVHYIAVNSTFLAPEIANQYGILRSERRGFVNVTILKNSAQGLTEPVTARVSGSLNNLMQQASPIEFVEVREGDAVYYLGQFEFSNAAQIRFELTVQPEQQGPEYELAWDTRLYIDR